MKGDIRTKAVVAMGDIQNAQAELAEAKRKLEGAEERLVLAMMENGNPAYLKPNYPRIRLYLLHTRGT